MSQMGRAVKPEELHGFPFAVVQSLSHIQLLAAPWIVAHQASLSFTFSWSLLKFMSIETGMPSNHLILCRPLLLLPSMFPSMSGSFPVSQLFASVGQSIGASASASVPPGHIQDWFPLVLIGLISLLSKGLSRIFFTIKVQRHHFFGAQPFLFSSFHLHTWLQLWLYGPL